MERQKRPASHGEGIGVATWREAGPQCHDRHEADNARENDHRLHDARRDVAERNGFLDPLDDRKEDDRSRDVADGEQDLEECARGDARVEPPAEDIAGVVEYRIVEEERRDREYKSAGKEQPKYQRRFPAGCIRFPPGWG